MKQKFYLLLLAACFFAIKAQAQNAEPGASAAQGVLVPQEAFTKSFTLSGSEHVIVNGVYRLNGLNRLGQPRYTHRSGDYDINYDGNGTWWLNTDKNLSGGPKYYRAAGSENEPPSTGWVDDQGQQKDIALVADPRNAAFDAQKNAPKPVITYLSREGTDDIDPNQRIEVKHVEATQVLNHLSTAIAKLLDAAKSTSSTHYVYNLRVGWYRINDDGGGCNFSGENPDPRYQVSTGFGFSQTINPGDDKDCGWQLMNNDGRYMLPGDYELTSSASPFQFTMNIFAWEEDDCGDDNSYNDDCFTNDDDHPASTSTTVTIDPSMMSLGYNSMDINWSGNGAQYGLRLEWELLPAPKIVTLYSDANLTGRTQHFGEGNYNVNSLFTGAGNDNVSSMQIAPGYKVITYNNSDYAGYPIEFRGTVNNLGGPNDRISSFQVVPDNGPPSTDKTLLIYFNGSGKSLEFQLQRFATQVNADQMIFIKGVGGAQPNYVGYNQQNLQHREEEDINQYDGFDAFNPFPTTFYSRAKVFKNDNFGGGFERYFFGVDMDYDGSVGAGYEDEDSYTAAANVLRVLRRYNLKGYSRIVISGHSRGSAVGISSFLYGIKKAIESDPQFAEFNGVVNTVLLNANTVNVAALDPVAGADTPGLRNDFHMGDGWRAREVYQWLKGQFSNINFSEIYANGGRMLESDELLGLGGFLFSNTFDPSPNYLHVEPSNDVQRYWLGYRHSSMVNKEEKWSELYDAAGIPRPWLHTAAMLNAGFYDQTLFRNHQHWYDVFQASDQKAWLKALELYGCTDSPSAQVGLDPLVVPDADLEFQHYHGTRHKIFNNSDASPVNMDDFVGNNDIKFHCSEVYQAPVAPGLYQASNTYTDGDGWTNYCTCTGKLLLSLKPGSSGANIPASGVSINIPNNSTYYVPGGTGFITNPNGAVMMGRTWNVSPTSQPSTNMGVRFYFNVADYENINTYLTVQRNEPPLNSVDELFFYQATSGSAHANAAVIPTANILRNGPVASTTNWLRGVTERGGDYFGEFQVASLAYGGGAGGENCLPTIICPENSSVISPTGQCSVVVNYTPPVGSTPGNCSNVTTTQTAGLPSGSAFPVGTTTNTFLATAANGRTTTCSFTVTVTDNQAPTITCPATQTLALGANCTAALPNYTTLAITGDNCGVQGVTQLPTAGTTVSNAGNMTVTLTVTDVNGLTNTCTFTVNKVDNTAPTITCPATQTLALGANCTASLPNYTTLATTGDNCGVQGVTQSPAAGTSVSNAGNMTVTLTVTDINGLTNSCQFTVTKVDNTAPTITCPATQTLALGANCSTTLPNYTALATTGDGCGVQGVTQSPAAGTTVSNAGNMTVTLTVTDINGLTNSCQFTVTKVDNTAPTITCPATQSLVLSANCTATLPNYTSLATTGDNCGVQGVTQSPAAGTTVSGAGNMSVTLTVTDINGLTNSCQFTVTKLDNTPPTIVCKNTTVAIGSAGTYTLQADDVFNATASSDNCSGPLTVTNISPAILTCDQLNQTIPVTVTVQDGSGNTSICTAQVTLQESVALPGGWSSANLGNANGSAQYKACSLNGAFAVSANGFSTASSDVLHLASRELCGNGEIIARVATISGGGWGGVMIRENLMPGAKKVSLKTQLNSLIRREIRAVTNGAASILNFNRPQHVWLRLVRDGSTFTGYTSLNGTTWSFAFSTTLSMTGCVQVGVFSESINAATTTTATFSNVSVNGSGNNLSADLANVNAPSENGEQVRVFPNPTTGEVTIDLDIHAGKPGTIQVFNALGALTTQERLIPGNPETHRLRIGDLAGVYTVVILLEDARIVRRVVVNPNGGK